MLNILPTAEKKKILTEYRLRLAVVVVFTITILVLVNLVLLVPSYLLATSKDNSIAGQLAAQEAKQTLGAQEKEIDDQVGTINKEISLFANGSTVDRLSPPDAIQEIIGMKNSAIRIQGFDYEVSGKVEELAITGVADDRDSLALFVDTLKKDPLFTTVDLPVSSYVKSTDIDFSIMTTREQVSAPAKK